LGAPPQLKSALDGLVTGVLHRYGLSSCLLLTESSDGLLRAEFFIGVSSAFAQTFQIPRGEGSIGVVFASALPRHIEGPNGHEDDALCIRSFSASVYRQRFFSRSKTEGRVLGTAFWGSQTLKTFSPETMEGLTELSDHLALALYNGKRVADLESSHRALEAQVASTVQELSRTHTRLVQKFVS